ncbi:aminotransferase class V-fold PLP-dependent enzyme [Eubacterium sp.]
MIYFDNAATTYPKPSSVLASAVLAMKKYSFNSGRGGYKESIKAGEMIYSVREKVASMFGFEPQNVAFTKNCTEALNMAIKGSVKSGDHIIISSLEHNSVSRVAEKLFDDGIIDYDIAKYSYNDDETVANFENLIKPNTTLVVCMHSSNAFGVTFPVAKIGKMCKLHGIRFVVDGAQGAGTADINAKRDNIDILCAPGHKCLLGAMGTGFIAVRDGLELLTVEEGGTGSNSMSLKQPDFLPDRLEAGTLNNSGIVSLGKGIDYINSYGTEAIYNHEFSLMQHTYKALENINDVVLYTPFPERGKTMPIISFNFGDYSSEKTAAILAKNDICTRAGFHCTPLAHKHFGTTDGGTVRISFGMFNTVRDCDALINVVKKF